MSDELESALERAKARGREWVENFRKLSADEQIPILAELIYERIKGGEMGRFHFDELPMEVVSQYDDPAMTRAPYFAAAAFVRKLLTSD